MSGGRHVVEDETGRIVSVYDENDGRKPSTGATPEERAVLERAPAGWTVEMVADALFLFSSLARR